MSEEKLKTFDELTNFQQWTIFYLLKNGNIGRFIKNEINNFCDTTRNNIDLNKFNEEMASLQRELEYFDKHALIEVDQTNQNSYIFSSKGELYCHQNLKQKLEILDSQSNQTKILKSPSYLKLKGILNGVIRSHGNLKMLASVILDNPKMAMTNIHAFNELYLILTKLLNS